MQPNQPQDDRSLSVPGRDDNTPSSRPTDREAATRLMRDQIDRIYAQPDTTGTTPPYASSNAYQRVHDDNAAHQDAGNEWHRYHSAWQQYYQQYYERYYLNQIDKQRQKVTTGPFPEATSSSHFPVSGDEKASADKGQGTDDDRAVHEIRGELLGKVKEHSTRIRKSRHFFPLISAAVVMLVFLGLQYNRVVIAQVKTYVSPGTINPQNIIVDPTSTTNVSKEPKLIIPKINVEAPVVYDVNSVAEGPIQTALKKGVVHYPIPGANAMPGQKGNTVVLGHSSNDVFDDGQYKFIFVQLDQLQKGDTFYLHHAGTRYTYSVTSKEIIDPTEVSKLVLPTDKPVATLVTCTPPGTALKRLVVYADQISPDPAKASGSASTAQPANPETSLPGYSPSLFERLFDS